MVDAVELADVPTRLLRREFPHWTVSLIPGGRVEGYWSSRDGHSRRSITAESHEQLLSMLRERIPRKDR